MKTPTPEEIIEGAKVREEWMRARQTRSFEARLERERINREEAQARFQALEKRSLVECMREVMRGKP